MDGGVRPDECGLGECALFGANIGLSRPYVSVGWLWTRREEWVSFRLVCYTFWGEASPVGGLEVVDGMADVS